MNPMKNPTCLALVVVLALSLGACGDKTSAPPTSPVAPTVAVPAPAPTPAPTPVGGATVTGSVAVASGPTGLRALTVSSSSYTIVVSVPGTSLSTTVDGVGPIQADRRAVGYGRAQVQRERDAGQHRAHGRQGRRPG